MNKSAEQLLQSSFSSDGCGSAIYNEIDSGPSSTNSLNMVNPSTIDQLVFSYSTITTPPAYGFRTRHLSCIEENDSDSYNSLPSEFIKNVDNTFTSAFEDQKQMSWEAEDVDYITTLDESRILDIESYEELNNVNGQAWTSTIYGPLHRHYEKIGNRMPRKTEEEAPKYPPPPIPPLPPTTIHTSAVANSVMITSGGPIKKYPKIMTTSCYGGLNIPTTSSSSVTVNNVATFESTIELDEGFMVNTSTEKLLLTSSQPEPIYAVPDKRYKSLNNSFVASPAILTADTVVSCNSLTNSIVEGKHYQHQNKAMSSSMSETVGETNIKIGGNLLELSVTSADGSRINWSEDGNSTATMLAAVDTDLQAIRRLLENETGGTTCPSCQMPFDKGKKRKLIDTCGHERCYTCMFRNEACPLCTQQNNNSNSFSGSVIVHQPANSTIKDTSHSMNKLHRGYDTGIGGSTSTIVSPLGSPQPLCRSQVRTNGNHAIYMQSRPDLTIHQDPASLSVINNNNPSTRLSTNLKFSRQQSVLNPSSNRSFSEISTSSCATPPQSRRRFFNPKNLRSPFGGGGGLGHRRTASNGGTDTTTLSGSSLLETSTCSDSVITRGIHQARRIRSRSTERSSSAGGEGARGSSSENDEGGNVKPMPFNTKSKSTQEELQTRLGFFLENNTRRNSRVPVQSCSSLASTNTSPVSTLTGSSEADVSRVLQEASPFHTGCDSIGSLMSVSISGHSNTSSSPLSRRHSVTTAQNGNVEDLAIFKTRKSVVRRSARAAQLKDNLDAKLRFGQYRSPQLTLKPLFFEVPLQEPDPLFVGRQWMLRELSNILTATETPGVLLNGNLGTGKTTLILQLVEYSCFGRRKELPITENDGIYCQINVGHDRIRSLASHVVAYHFCQADNNSTCLVPDFIHSLAAQLCQAPQLSAYREYLISEPHLQNILSVKECVADPERVMRMGILEPLIALKRSGKILAKNCLILVDALCEAEYHRPDHGHTIASFLGKMTEYFPSWLKVVATVRTQMLEFVKGLAYTKMTLDSWGSNEYLQKDMLDYITFRINHSSSILSNVGGNKDSSTGQFKFATHLLSLTRGSFLYAKLVLDLIERGHLVVKSSSYKVLPVSLAQIFLLSFNLRFPTTSSYEKASQILNVCLAALYPLTLNEIYYSVSALNSEESLEWDEFLSRFKLLSGFLVKRIDNTYMFFHPSFREWLMRRDDGESSKFLCDFRLGHAAIAFRQSRLQVPLDAEHALELGHHILKAHIYRNTQSNQSPRDMQAYWVAAAAESVSAALCTLRNVYSPNVKVSRLLLLAGASPDFQTDFMGGATILCIAAHEGIVPMVSLLLEFGADVERTNSQGCSPLILAAMKGHCDVVRLLVAAGSGLGQVDTTQRCALVHAARAGKLSVVKYLLASDWIARSDSNDISLREAAQQSLIASSSQEHNIIVEDLLDIAEVSVDAVDTLTGDTALTAAAKNGCTETVATLLSRCASVDIRNRAHMSPLLLAVKEGHWAVAERLLQNAADIEQTDPSTKTALIIAAEEGHVGIIELLIDRGASLDKQDKEGLTALCWACLRGRLQAAKCLIERGSDKDHVDSAGRTALDLAAYQGSASLVQLLLDKGAKLEHVDINGMRPLDRAIACRNIQVVSVFLKRGAKLGPATWAMAAGKPEILLLLLNKLLEDGNILYRKNRLQEAAHRYQYALRKIPSSDGQTLEHAATFAQLRVNFLLNHSRCKRKLNELAEAIDLATQAIDLKPSSYEGYYARSKAYLEIDNIPDALADAELAVEKASSVNADIKGVLQRLRNEIVQRHGYDDGSSMTGNHEYDSVENSTDL